MEFIVYIRWILLFCYRLCIAKRLEESSKIHFTNSWAVHIENGSDEIASQIAEKHGFFNFGQIGSLPGYYQFVHKEIKKRRKRREVSKTVTLLLEDKIQWVEQQHVLERDKRSIIPDYIDVIHPNGYTIQDPLYSDQWYINNVGQSSGPPGLDINVLPVWSRGISGRGVVVAILDDGLDHTHPDLKANYDAKASYDFNDYDEDPMPRSSDPNNCHGTKCAGEVAAEAGNGVCGVGVAFNSSVGGIRMLDGNVTDTIEGSALSYHKDYIDIYSCAWGPKDDGKRFGRPGTLASKALELGVKEGRNGLGSIFVWATGNGGLTDDDCNCDGYTTSVYTVSIGAISDHGLSTYYTESCASTLAVTYSGGSHREKKENKIVTTTLGHKCTDEFKGTSSAAPLAAGMIALVLESNSNVTWRDVQHIIVETSVMSSPLDEGWRRNGAGKWFNQKFGFGRMDAAAMVEKAATWNSVVEQRNCWSDKSSGPWTIPSSGTLLVAMNTTACAETTSNIKVVEHVQVIMSLQHRRRGHLSIELISPSGTRTQLLKTRRNDRSTKGLKDWVFMSVHFWGEDPKGLWTLAVTDNNNNDREHHLEKNKYGDMEDATGALQDLIEEKEDTIEHEKIVEDDDLFKSAEEFENRIFKDATYKRKRKEKSNEQENYNGQGDNSEQATSEEKNTENNVETGKGKGKGTLFSLPGGTTTDAMRDNSNSNSNNNNNINKQEENDKKETKLKTKETKKEKAKHKEDERKAAKMKSSEKNVANQKKSKRKSHNKTKSKKKKKITAEEDAEAKIVEELLKDSKPVNYQEAIKSKSRQSNSPNLTSPLYQNYQNIEQMGASMYPLKPYAYPIVNVSSNYQTYLTGPLINQPDLPSQIINRNSSMQVNGLPTLQITMTSTTPSPKIYSNTTKGLGKLSDSSIVGSASSHLGLSEENTTLESVLRNVLNEVFANFKQENQGYKTLADRIQGLEIALQDKNKTQHHNVEQTYSSILLNAFKKGKPIDKIQNVLGVLENRRNLTKNSNSSFSKNAEVVTDVLKVLKDILSTKKDDSELKGYKKRISKLLETSSNSTRQLTEKLFNDIEPTGDGKESSTSVMNDALALISHIFQRNKPHQSSSKVSKDLHVSLTDVKGTQNEKNYENIESLTKEQSPLNPQDSNDYEPLTNILLRGDFLKDNGGSKDKDETPMIEKEKATMKEDENMKEIKEKNENFLEKAKLVDLNVRDKSKLLETPKKLKDEYEIVGIAERNGEHIISSPDNGNELGMNQPANDDSRLSYKNEFLESGEDKHRSMDSQTRHHEGGLPEHHREGELPERHRDEEAEEGETRGRHHKQDHLGESQDWRPEGERHHNDETHKRYHDAAEEHRHEDEEEEDMHVGKHDFPTSEDGDDTRNEPDDDSSDFTIAIMKDGKKIGERKVNKFQASHYLVKPKLTTEYIRDEDNQKTEGNEGDDILLKSSIFQYSKPLVTNAPKEHDIFTPEDNEKGSIFEYNKMTRPSNSESVNGQKDADFDVTKFALSENRFSEHTTDHAGKHEAEDVAEDTDLLKETKQTEDFFNRKVASLGTGLKEDKEVKEFTEEKGEKEERDGRTESTKRKFAEEEKEEKKGKPTVNKKIKKISSKTKSRKAKERSSKREEEEYDEHYVHFNEPLPFMQMPDPSQFAQIPLPADENENFLQPSYETFNPNGMPDIVNLPDYQEHTSFYNNRGAGYETDNQRIGEYGMKRSSIPSSMQDIQLYSPNDVELERRRETERPLIRRRRSLDLSEEELPKNIDRQTDATLFRFKRDVIEQEDDDDEEGPHVVKRSAIISEIYPSRKPEISTTNGKRSSEHRFAKRVINSHKSNASSKRSAVRKSTDFGSIETNSKNKPLSRESSSVLNIIKRVHDDIAIGNSKDLRRLESELAKLEGISMSESNEQVNNFEKLAKQRINTVRAKVTKKYREDPDEYYKYGATASGILESWTLHFYGTGP